MIVVMADPNNAPPPAQANHVPVCTMQALLEDSPLHSQRKIFGVYDISSSEIQFPESIWLHCEHEKCDGKRRYLKAKTNQFRSKDLNYYDFAVYVCSNCAQTVKVFATKSILDEKQPRSGICTKIYEEPPFGQPIPKRLFHVIGESNREYFLQARRAIARGLGIGAYGYYRRIVENTKFDLIGSVLVVAEATNAPPAQVELLKRAQNERQFSKAIDILRDASAIPAVLLIDGHNPLALLHDALSEGIHELSDSECLERAQDAEVILCEIANRVQVAVTEHKTVKAALFSILKRKSAGAGQTQ